MTPSMIMVRPANAPAGEAPREFNAEFTIGRHPSSDIVVANSTIVSGTHLKVTPLSNGWQLQAMIYPFCYESLIL